MLVVRGEDLRAHRHEREGPLANPAVSQAARREAATADRAAAARQPHNSERASRDRAQRA